MTFPRFAIATGLLAVALAAGAQTADRKTYIVQLADAPATTYAGSIGGLAATRPVAGSKFDAATLNVRAYVNYLERQRAGALAKAGNPAVVHRYDLAFNGFSAQLTDAQVKALRASTGVLAITESALMQPDTTRTPAFLGLSTPNGVWSQLDAASRKVKGEDVIIGMIDSGVWPEDPSFSDKVGRTRKPVAYNKPGELVYGAPPAKWKGACVTGEGFTSLMCNNKLIGARYYVNGFLAGIGPLNSLEYKSPRDGDGHGTHTASTAGGNEDVDASIDGSAVGAMSGIAPRARLAAYKVCWEGPARSTTDSGCSNTDILKAIDDAIADGVDVINFSISGSQTSFTEPTELAFFNAAAAGIFVAASAGNSGPANQVAHISPWLTTVAASTHDRYTLASVTLGAPSGAVFSGPSYQKSGLPSKAIILSQDAGVQPLSALTAPQQLALQRCYNPALADDVALGASASTALDPAKVNGKIVVCIRGGNVLVNKGSSVTTAGGAGMIIQNGPGTANTTINQPYLIPTVHLDASSYDAVVAYAATAGATASFGPGIQQAGVVAPVMATFSSRGPNKANGNVLKPDISGPGVDIIAGWLDSTLTQAQHDALLAGTFMPKANAQSIQGTSMSSPHIAGAAALLKQLYPTWSPSAIKSALMTSTNDIKLANGTADPDRWGYGAGHVNPGGSLNPGLVYDAATADYVRFLCGLSLTPPAGSGTCAALGSIQPWNLNLASLTASDVAGTLTFTRRVTNVTGASATFNSATNLAGWNVVVSPPNLTLAAGASATFTVALTKTTAAVGAWSFGSLAWNDNAGHVVRSPLSARALGFVAPAQSSTVNATGTGTAVINIVSGFTGTLGLSPVGLVPATLTTGLVAQNGAQCFNVVVGAGAQLARFQLFNADTLGGSATDLDLSIYNGPNGTGTLVGASEGGTSDEVVTLAAPGAGTYSACIAGFATPAGGASYALSSWVVGPAVGAQTLKASAPAKVYAGGSASVGVKWVVPAGRRYLGNLTYIDSGNAAGPTVAGSTVVFVDAR